MCHRICPHILAKTQYWKVLVSCAPPSIRPQVNPNHIVQDFVAICQELEPPCHQSSICLLLPPICQQVWEQAKLSWYGSLGHGCENFYIAPIPTQALRQGYIALVPIYTFSTQLQFRSRYWGVTNTNRLMLRLIEPFFAMACWYLGLIKQLSLMGWYLYGEELWRVKSQKQNIWNGCERFFRGGLSKISDVAMLGMA